jgi:DNA replication and repair protein RecF
MDLVRWGAARTTVDAVLEDGTAPRRFSLGVLADTKRLAVRLDGKRPETASEYFGAIQMVLFHPGDVDVVRAGPDVRRRFLDRLLYQLFPGYADDHRRYAKAHKSRNRLLATGAGDAALDAWEETMAPLAERIARSRAAAVSPLATQAGKALAEIGGADEDLGVRYRPSVSGDAATFASRWAVDRSIDREIGRTRAGPHRDEIEISIGGRPARGTASQGQQRSIALALKLAEVGVLEGLRHRRPILLLDDVSSELDPRRNEALFRALEARAGQVYVTTTRKEYVRAYNDRKDFRISAGTLVAESP